MWQLKNKFSLVRKKKTPYLHNNMQIALRFSIFKFKTCNNNKEGILQKGILLISNWELQYLFYLNIRFDKDMNENPEVASRWDIVTLAKIISLEAVISELINEVTNICRGVRYPNKTVHDGSPQNGPTAAAPLFA